MLVGQLKNGKYLHIARNRYIRTTFSRWFTRAWSIGERNGVYVVNMCENLVYRKATLHDLSAIIELILEDELAHNRESPDKQGQHYVDAFYQIDMDPNHYLMVVERGTEIVATCHLTVIASLSFKGSTRLQTEEVRVRKKHRSMGIGKWMFKAAIAYGVERGAKIVQLTANKKRTRAKTFYEKLGFENSHEGMKLYVGENQ